MARHIIAFEGRKMFPGQIVEKGAFFWGPEPIYITKSAEYHSDLPVGKATDLRREEDGSITAELSCEVPEGMAATVYCTSVASNAEYAPEHDGDVLVISALIRQVFFTAGVPWVGKRPGDDIQPLVVE